MDMSGKLLALDSVTLQVAANEYSDALDAYIQGPGGEHPTTDHLAYALATLCIEALKYQRKHLPDLEIPDEGA